MLEAWEGGQGDEGACWDGRRGGGDSDSEGDGAEIEVVVGVYDA